jgi:hypothetical protein
VGSNESDSSSYRLAACAGQTSGCDICLKRESRVALDYALMMEAVSTSETSVSFCQTTLLNIPEDSHVHTRRRENRKSQLSNVISVRK